MTRIVTTGTNTMTAATFIPSFGAVRITLDGWPAAGAEARANSGHNPPDGAIEAEYRIVDAVPSFAALPGALVPCDPPPTGAAVPETR